MKELWYFYATWCTYCKQQTPILDEFIAEHPEVTVIKILEEENKDAVEMNNIQNFPTFMVLKGNEPMRPVSGLTNKAELEKLFA